MFDLLKQKQWNLVSLDLILVWRDIDLDTCLFFNAYFVLLEYCFISLLHFKGRLYILFMKFHLFFHCALLPTRRLLFSTTWNDLFLFSGWLIFYMIFWSVVFYVLSEKVIWLVWYKFINTIDILTSVFGVVFVLRQNSNIWKLIFRI